MILIHRENIGLRRDDLRKILVGTNGYIYTTSIRSGIYRSRDKFVSVEETPKPSDGIVISPNPATDFIEISVGVRHAEPLQSEFKIYNIFGQTVSTPVCSADTPAGGGQRIDVSGLAPGLYFVRIGDKVNKFAKL